MNTDYAFLAVEDAVSEALGRRLLAEFSISVLQVVGLKGNTYLRRKAGSLNRTARAHLVLLLTDQDSPAVCPPQLVGDWLQAPRQAGMLFRVAVMEAEAWVLADAAAFGQFVGVDARAVPQPADAVACPKETVVSLARTSRIRAVRDDLVPPPSSTASVGPAYNAWLTEFVRSSWRPRRAAASSPSLTRAIAALEGLVGRSRDARRT